jgi:glyoxylase-like metal-dependent hydrolase (beta-lactamase superfamily II)
MNDATTLPGGRMTHRRSALDTRCRALLRALALLAAIVTACAPAAGPVPIGAAAAEPGFPDRWVDGTSPTEPLVQVHRYDRDLFILRQSPRAHPEAPFMYLLFGADRALLVDTGAGHIPIGDVVASAMATRLKERGKTSMPLVVAHSHSHGDHWAGDDQFPEREGVTRVKLSPQDVRDFFGIAGWPDQIVPFDLGGRIVDVIPAPGHEPSHVIFFDRQTRLVLTGDTLYPGRLYFRGADFAEYRRTIDRVVAFTKSRNVSWLLGAHVEMTRTPGQDFPVGAPVHRNEHRLQLPYGALLELQQVLRGMGDSPRRVARDHFIVYPTR